jgi:hypothetical protein
MALMAPHQHPTDDSAVFTPEAGVAWVTTHIHVTDPIPDRDPEAESTGDLALAS